MKLRSRASRSGAPGDWPARLSGGLCPGCALGASSCGGQAGLEALLRERLGLLGLTVDDRYLGVPALAPGLATDAKYGGIQAGYEKALKGSVCSRELAS